MDIRKKTCPRGLGNYFKKPDINYFTVESFKHRDNKNIKKGKSGLIKNICQVDLPGFKNLAGLIYSSKPLEGISPTAQRIALSPSQQKPRNIRHLLRA